MQAGRPYRAIGTRLEKAVMIPNRDRAIIESSKLTEYLLNPEHKRGGTKAKLLIQCGYSQENYQQLETDIRAYHLSEDIDIVKETA